MQVLVYGSQEFGQVIRHLVDDVGCEFGGFIDDWFESPQVLGNWQEITQQFSPDEVQIAIAIGYKNLALRLRMVEQVRSDGFTCCTLIHPRAIVAKSASIGEGSFVMAGCTLDCSVSIGMASVCWPGVVVSHDSIVAKNVFLSPNSTICGGCKIGHSTFIGAGAVVIEHVTVAPQSFVPAGSVFSPKK